MKFATTFALGITLVWSLAASAGDAKKELDKLQGAWKCQSYEVGGTKIEGEALQGVMESITIKGGAYAWKQGNETAKGTIKLDGTKKPKHIDFVFEMEGVKVTAWVGVYSVEGDTLKLAIGPPIGERATDFATKNVARGVFTLKRGK